jgi:hypothetical protein
VDYYARDDCAMVYVFILIMSVALFSLESASLSLCDLDRDCLKNIIAFTYPTAEQVEDTVFTTLHTKFELQKEYNPTWVACLPDFFAYDFSFALIRANTIIYKMKDELMGKDFLLQGVYGSIWRFINKVPQSALFDWSVVIKQPMPPHDRVGISGYGLGDELIGDSFPGLQHTASKGTALWFCVLAYLEDCIFISNIEGELRSEFQKILQEKTTAYLLTLQCHSQAFVTESKLKQLLYNHKEDINCKDSSHTTLLSNVLNYPLQSEEKKDVVELLIETGADISLLSAAEQKQLQREFGDIFVENRLELKLQDLLLESMFGENRSKNRCQMIEDYLCRGANPNKRVNGVLPIEFILNDTMCKDVKFKKRVLGLLRTYYAEWLPEYELQLSLHKLFLTPTFLQPHLTDVQRRDFLLKNVEYQEFIKERQYGVRCSLNFKVQLMRMLGTFFSAPGRRNNVVSKTNSLSVYQVGGSALAVVASCLAYFLFNSAQ